MTAHRIATLTIAATLIASAQDRMPPIPADQLTEAQKQAMKDYEEIRGRPLTAPPWSVLLRIPDLVVPSLQLRMHNQSDANPLGPKLTEFLILIASRDWTNNYEWSVHANVARTAGLSPDIIAAIAEGRRPDNMAEDEAILWDFSDELIHNKSVSNGTYAKALAKFGEEGIVEAASLQGYYAFLAMMMNLARSPLAGDAEPQLAPFPHNDPTK